MFTCIFAAYMQNSISDLFYTIGKNLTKHEGDSVVVGLRRFKSFFGVSPQICALTWNLIKYELPDDYKEVHLLWALLFLKCYNTESVNRAIVGCDEKTFRKRVWMVVDKLAFMKVVSMHCGFSARPTVTEIVFKVKWEDRKTNANPRQTCYTSLDGVDFEIQEPGPFSSRWFSHKLNAAGLRYEIGLCIRTGEIVWANGGYPCGSWSDLKIAREHFVHFLEPNEKALADKGYPDSSFFILPTQQNQERHELIMSRHETINKRIKQFNVLTVPFRHDLSKHKICTHSVINVTQLVIENEEPLFSVY